MTVVADERTNRLIIKGDRITRQRMAQMVRSLDTPDSASSGVQVVRLTDITFDEAYDLELGGRTLELRYFGPNHGDSLVVKR